MRDNVPNVADDVTPATLRRPPLSSQERHQLMLDALASVRAGFWLFNGEALALVETHGRRLRDLLALLAAGEVDDAIALLERLLATDVDPDQTQIEALP
jgi:hypothetical protein